MSLFNIFKKKNTNNSVETVLRNNDIFSLPCNYCGYDLVFEMGVTDPKLYSEITSIITNNRLSIDNMKTFNTLSKDSSEDDFIIFYDEWIDKLKNNNFVVSLDSYLGIKEFSESINAILKSKGQTIQINVESIVKRYNSELSKYTFNGQKISDNFKYDILEANIIADELRKYGYELICFFNGFDNNIKTFIKFDEIDKMKEIEVKLKNYSDK